MIEPTLESTKGEPVSHSSVVEQKEGLVWWGCLMVGLAILGGLVIKATSDYPVSIDQTQGGAPVSVVSPVQSYGPGASTSSVQEMYDRLLAPQDNPVVCEPSSGNPIADLMLGINAC